MPKSYRKKTIDSNEIKSKLNNSSGNMTKSISPRKKVKSLEEFQICSKNVNTSETTSNIYPNNDVEINISSFEYLKRKRKRVKFFIKS